MEKKEGHDAHSHKCHESNKNGSKDHKHHAKNHSHEHSMQNPEMYLKKLYVSLLLMIPILVLSPSFQSLLGFEFTIDFQMELLVLLSSILFFYSGFLFIEHAYHEFKMRKPGMMMLIALAISVAYLFSLYSVVFGFEGRDLFWELASLIFVMLLGHYIEAVSIARAKDSLKKLAELIPKKAHLIKNGKIVDVPSSELRKGDVVIVKPGERIPADGIIIEGKAEIDESLISGESKPVKKKRGEEVVGGSISLGSIRIKVEKSGKDLYISHLIEIVREAQESKYKTQDLANKAAAFLFYIAIFSAVITYSYWSIAGSPSDAIERTITVLVIACPHALGLAIPLVVAISTSLSATSGVLIRRKDAFEKLKDAKYIFFDKTGTLTEGKFKVVESTLSNEDFEKVASIELFSEHSISHAIVEHAKSMKIKLSKEKVKNFEYKVGRGVIANYGRKKYYLGNDKLMKELGIEAPKIKGGTVVYVSDGKKLLGHIVLSDPLREEAYSLVEELRKRGVRVVMLTGDNEATAKNIANKLGIEYRASLLPHEKSEIVDEYKKEGVVVFVGDGINDTISLAKADVGIAMNSLDVVANIGDIILTKNDISMIYKLIDFSRKVYRKMMENLVWATFYNVFAIPAAAGLFLGLGITLSPAIAALFMSLSTVIVAVNAQLLNKEKSLLISS